MRYFKTSLVARLVVAVAVMFKRGGYLAASALGCNGDNGDDNGDASGGDVDGV